LIPLSILVLALVLAACGGGGESDEDKITDTIETSVLSTDGSACTDLETLKFVEQTQNETGKAAIKSCEENAKDGSDDPDSVAVTQIEVDGSNASADAAFVGGSFDGQTLSVALVEEDGTWKLDEATGFAKFDKAKLITAFRSSFEGENVEPKLASCLIEALEGAGQGDFEELMFSGSSQPIVELVKACEG
jgi:hypothetical protein